MVGFGTIPKPNFGRQNLVALGRRLKAIFGTLNPLPERVPKTFHGIPLEPFVKPFRKGSKSCCSLTCLNVVVGRFR